MPLTKFCVKPLSFSDKVELLMALLSEEVFRLFLKACTFRLFALSIPVLQLALSRKMSRSSTAWLLGVTAFSK